MLVIQLCETTVIRSSDGQHFSSYSPKEDMPDESGNQAGRAFQRFAEDGADRGW